MRRSVLVVLSTLLATTGLAIVAAPDAGATSVNDQSSFRTAWGDPNETRIDLAADITLTCGAPDSANRNSATAIVVDGHGFTITQTCANAVTLEQGGSGKVTLQNVTVTGANAVNADGIESQGEVVVIDGHLDGNGTDGASLDGPITLVRSTASRNGGFGTDTSGTATITDSSVRDNGDNGVNTSDTAIVTRSSVTGNQGAGVRTYFEGGAISVVNSTVADNVAAAVYGPSPATITYSTITGNGGGILAGSVDSAAAPDGAAAPLAVLTAQVQVESATVFGTVIAQRNGASRNCFGTFTSTGYDYSDDASCAFTAAGDVQNGADPQLGALTTSGGATAARIPAATSPLVDAIPAAACGFDGITVDQWGTARPQGTGCEIGAIEVIPAVALEPAFTG